MSWVESAMVEEVRREWLQLPQDTAAIGAWVGLYDELGSEELAPYRRKPPRRVWFVDFAAAHEREVHSFARFVAVVLERRWLAPSATFGPSEQVFGQRHEIGVAAIGPLGGTSDWCLAFQWGGLHGAGYRYTLDHAVETVRRGSMLWVS